MLKIKNIPILYRYFLSFFLVAMIPISIMSFLLYTTNVANLKQKTNEASITSLVQLKSRMDYIIKDFSSVALNTSSKYNIHELFNKDVTDVNERTSIIEHYEETLLQNPGILLYRHGENIVYMADGPISYSTFENSISNEYDMTMVRFFNRLNKSTSFQLFSNKHLVPYRTEELSICFLYPLPYNEIIPIASMVFVLNNSQMAKIFEDYMGSLTGDFFIYDTYLSLAYHQGFNSDLKFENIEEINNKLTKLKGTGINNMSIGGQKYIAIRTISEDSGLTYCVLMTYNRFYQQITKAKLFFYSFIFTLMSTGIILALLLATYNYRPVNHILRLMAGASSMDKKQNEFEIISNTYKKLLGSNKVLLYQIEKQRPIIKEQCLQRLIQDGGKTEDIHYYLQCANIQFHYSQYFVMIISLSGFNFNIGEICRIVEEIPFESTLAYGIELTNEKNMVGVIINTEDKQPDVISCSNKIMDMIASTFEAQLVIGIGTPYGDIVKCNTSFLEAKTALQFRDINDTQKIYTYDTTIIHSEESYQYPSKEQALFIQSIRHGNSDVALTALDEFIERIRVQARSFIIIRYIFFETINQIVRLAHQQNVKLDVNETLKESAVVNSIEDFKNKMIELSNFICEGIKRTKEEKYKKLKKGIIEYINTYYCQFKISMEMVANQFNISASYLGRIVREETGHTFNQYITTLRLEEAKRLLRDTDEKVKDIVSKVGYVDVANFIRKFKTIENVTPNQYRTIKRYEKQKRNNV